MSTYGLWLSTAGMKVNDHRQALIANNIANAHTAGFKHDLAVVSPRAVESREGWDRFMFRHPVLDGMAGGMHVQPTYYSREQGSIESTGRPLDIAISGDGFFAVSDGKDTRYTRNGEFTVSSKGELLMASEAGSWRVLDEGGSPLTIDAAGERVSVSPNGTVRQGLTSVGKLALMSNEDPHAMRKVGENLFESTGGRMAAASGSFVPESREASTFDPVMGLTSLMEATRSYQMNARLLQMQDDMTEQLVTTLGRVA
jgi:flagellar basal body rod protein FlgG